MKNLLYFHTYDRSDCLRRVAALLRHNYRIVNLVVREHADGSMLCQVKATRSLWGYLACLLRKVQTLTIVAMKDARPMPIRPSAKAS